MNWQPASTPPPRSTDPDDCYGSWTDSVAVLVLEQSGRMVVARYRWEEDDPYMESKWVECGRDAYDVDDVTHWMPLPAPPEEGAA